MAKYPGAKWLPLPENATHPSITPTQVILHSAVDARGPTSLYGFFAREDVKVESHFFIRLDGSVEQYMDTEVRADANYHASVRAISIETEDDGDPDNTPWTPAQLVGIEDIIRWANRVHGVPLELCPVWDQPGIGWHSMWGAPSHWTPVRGKTCPGRIRIAQIKNHLLPRLQMKAETKPATKKVPNMVIVHSSGGAHILSGGKLVGIQSEEDLEAWRKAGIPETGHVTDDQKRANYVGFKVTHKAPRWRRG